MSVENKPGYGAISRGRDSVKALRALAGIRAGARQFATDTEREDLRLWSGWGPLKDIFAPPTEAWAQMNEEMTGLLSEADVKLGVQGTYNAFFTPDAVTERMWALLRKLGFDGGKVAELGCGAGGFMASAPDDADMVGVERDPTSAAIARLLNPRHTVINKPLQDVSLASDFAAVIGNVPFGNVKIFDPAVPDKSEVSRTLHHYFVWRALRCLAPGGLAVLLVSRYFMDGLDEGVREHIDALGDFVGAVRLPNGGLEGGTEALADIVVFRRKIPGTPRAGQTWGEVTRNKFGHGVHVNAYWDERPGLVLGTMREGKTTQYGLGLLVEPLDGESVPDGIRRVMPHLAQDARDMGLRWVAPVKAESFDENASEVSVEDGWLENSFHLRQSAGRTKPTVYVVRDVGKLQNKAAMAEWRKRKKAGADEPAPEPLTPKLVASPIPHPDQELVALIKLRDLAEKLIDAEANFDLPDAEVDKLRRPVARAYRDYVSKKGFLRRGTTFSKGFDPETGVEEFGRRTPSMGGFRHDPGWPLVAALEIFDDEEQVGTPAPILLERQNRPVVKPEHTDDVGTALAWCLDRCGEVDLAYIAQLMGIDGEDGRHIAEMLGDKLFQEPGYETWLTAEEYLSGNIREKLRTAETAAAVEPRYQRNVDALKKVLPQWLAPGEIIAALGTPWIPPSDIQHFTIELFGFGGGAKIKHFKDSNRWDVEPMGSESSTAASETWGMPEVSGYELLQLALNGKVPEVKVRTKTGSKKDDRLSLQAAQVQQRIKDRFREWVWEDAERAERLANYYNNTFNCLVTRSYDGSHITIAGLAASWADKLYAHQRDFIARVLASPATLCAHPVGAGKTATMTCSAMKLAELGLVTKPMLVVPNHLIEQADAAARQMFPGKKILSANSETISASRRAFTARVATQHWDLIIITHSAFDRMPVHPSTEVAYKEQQVESLRSSLIEAAPDGKLKGRQVKAMAKKLDNLEADISGLQRRTHVDGGCTFEQLGVRWIGIDEAHFYKNLAVPCYNEGFSIAPSKRASHLDMVLRWLSKQGSGRYASLFTGTPVSNTMLELYVMKQYLMPGYLDTIDLGSADAWCAAYVEMVTKVGVTVDGSKFVMQTRPARFINAPELRVLFSMVADVRTAEELGIERPEEIPEVVTSQPTSKQAVYSQILVSRATAIKGVRFPGEGADNMLKICNDGRFMATDPALVGIRDDEPGKLHAAAEQIVKVWREHPDELQLVFCDIGTPNDKKGSQTYGRLRKLLVDMGMPIGQIEFAHSAKSDADKAAQFRRARTGNMLVLMGSTGKMGTGTNVQDRVIAMHHLDAPYTPASVEQRDGRGIRPGNRNKQVLNFRYVTAKTFDAYLWQMLVRKLTFISQLMTGKLDRAIEDCATDQLMSFAAVQASATGQPLLMERETVAADVNRLRGLQAMHRQRLQRQHRQIPLLKAEIEKKLTEHRAWEAIAAADVPEISKEGAEQLHELMKTHRYREPEVQFGGLTVGFGSWLSQTSEQREPELRVSGGAGWVTDRLYSSYKPDTIAKRVMELVAKAEVAAPLYVETIEGLRGELAEKERLLDVEFPEEAELIAAQAKLDQLDAQLRKEAEPNDESGTVVVDGEEAPEDVAGKAKLTAEEAALLAEIEAGAGLDLDGTIVRERVPAAPVTPTPKQKQRVTPLPEVFKTLGDGPTLAEQTAATAAAVKSAYTEPAPVAESRDTMASVFGQLLGTSAAVAVAEREPEPEPEPEVDPREAMGGVFAQLLGDYERSLEDKMAEAMRKLGIA